MEGRKEGVLEPVIAHKQLSRIEKVERVTILDAVGLASGDELEPWALFCACNAWTGLETKTPKLIKLHKSLSGGFIQFLKNPNIEKLRIIWPNQPQGLFCLCKAINEILEEHGTIRNLVTDEQNVLSAIFKLGATIRKNHDNYCSEGKGFRGLPKVKSTPPLSLKEKKKQSALKRYCMFFRWMVRDEEPDLGLWDFFDKKDLYHPLDTHVARVMNRWNVLPNQNRKWYNVEVVTDYFRKVTPNDPTRYDYHLVTFGQKICTKKDPKCSECLIFNSEFKCNL